MRHFTREDYRTLAFILLGASITCALLWVTNL